MGDVIAADFPEGAPDFGRAVQHQPTAHAGRGAGIDLVEQRGTQKAGAVDGSCEQIGQGIEYTPIVVIGIIKTDPGP